MQVKTIIDGQITSSGESVVNVTKLTKFRPVSKWYTQTDGNEVFILLHIIVHPKLEFPP